jgi:transposase
MRRDNYTRTKAIFLINHIGLQNSKRIAELCSVSVATIYRWHHEFNLHGTITYQRHRRRKNWSSLPPNHIMIVVALLEEYPMLYMREVAHFIHTKTNVNYSPSQVHRAIVKYGFTHQVLEYRAREQCRLIREIYLEVISHYSAIQIVFADETHTKPENCRRKYGYGMLGQPAFRYVYGILHGQGTSSCGVCALGVDGMLSAYITEEIVDGDHFCQVLEKEILPQMRPFPEPHSVLILDNASTHNHDRIVFLCQHVGVRVHFLPPYSYDFSAIEPAFHEAKATLRSQHGLDDKPYTKEALLEALAQIGARTAIGYFRHCGITVSALEEEMALNGELF